MDIGSNGLIQLDLIIPRGTSFEFSIELQDESGEYVSLEDATFKMAFKQDYQPFDVSRFVTGNAKGLSVSIPFKTTKIFPICVMQWDCLVYTSDTDCFRIAYGKVKIVDTVSDEDLPCW